MKTGENAEAGAPLLRVCGLARNFGAVRAVEDVTLSAFRGDVVGLLGLNGAGKTTTLRMLTTALAPSAGTGTISGFDLVSQSDDVRRRIGYLPEVPPLYDEMTVFEYLHFIAELRGIPRRNRRAAISDVMKDCGLGEVSNRLCRNLSRGFRQRTGLAQAVIHHPEVIILDEPTSGLDPQQIVQIRRLILALAHGRLVILSTHLLPEVSMLCNRVAILHRGRVVMDQDLKSLRGEEGLDRVFLRCVGAEDEPVGLAEVGG